MPQPWNPNTPHTFGLELPNQGSSYRRIAGLQQQLLTFKALATEAVASALVPIGPSTVATILTPPRKPRFSEALPDFTTIPMNTIEGVVCADIGFPGQAIYMNEYLPASIGSVMNGTVDHRYARNDDLGIRADGAGNPLPTVSTVNSGLVSDITVEGDGNYLSDPNGNKHIGSSSFTFDCAGFPSGRHVLAIEFVIRANGPIVATIANNDITLGTWRSSPARMYYESTEFENHLYRIGEAYIDNRDGVTNEIWRLTPGIVQAFSPTSGLRRLVVATDASPLSLALVRSRIDYIAMRVFSTDESRQATGWVSRAGRVTFRVPSDVRRASDTAASPAPYSKTLNATQNILLRQFFPGNIPMPSMVLSTPRLYAETSFAADWRVRDTVGSPQSYGPTAPAREPEPVTASLTLFTALNNDNAVSAETQPYSSTGGVFPYSGGANGEKPTTKNFPTGSTGLTLMYALVSDSLGPKNNITFTLGSTPDTGGTVTSVTMTPAEIAAFPIVGHSTVSGSGFYGTNLPWALPPTVVRWRRVRVLFPTPITFGGTGGRVSVKALPNVISRAGFTENYLIGGLFPQTKGGLFPTQTLSGDHAVPAVTTDGGVTYNAGLAFADLQLTFPTAPPVPVVTAALQVDRTVSGATVESHPRVTFTWAQGAGLAAKQFQIERYDDITGEYQRIFNVTAPGTYDDYEARFNVASTYRVRVVRTDNAESAYGLSAPITPVLTECKLAFSSNTDPTINSAYTDTYSGDTAHAYASRDAGAVDYRRIYGRDYEVAFRRVPSGGVEFNRNVLHAPTTGERPPQNVNKALLEMTRNQKVPYICVRDSTSNRWFASVTHGSLLTTRSMGCNGPVAMSTLSIVEVTKTPITE